MTKKNRNRMQGSSRHQGNVRQVITSPAPPAEVRKAPLAPPVPASTVAPLLLTVADVCALLNVSRSTLLRLEKAGSLPGRVKLGGQVRYHREKIERWLLEQCE